jgi:ectoine hydroxylase
VSFKGISDSQVEQFNQDGYLFLEALFDPEEMDLLLTTAKADRALDQHALALKDGEGGVSKLTLWYKPGDDIYGMFARCPRVVDTMERLLDDTVYHYHSKMMLKEPYTGGAWTWHQDYGYWYNAGYLYPDMASCLIAVDRASRENGCLQVLRGSHKLGRVDHVLAGDQTGADLSRVEQALKRLELVYCEMEPGTALFFHSNVLHRSDQNRSPNSRWSLICAYTAARNVPPFNEPNHPGYEPLVKVPDSAIKEMGGRALRPDAEFLNMQRIESYNESLDASRGG